MKPAENLGGVCRLRAVKLLVSYRSSLVPTKDFIIVVRLEEDLSSRPISTSLTKHYPAG